jgi:hypothetical protein
MTNLGCPNPSLGLEVSLIIKNEVRQQSKKSRAFKKDRPGFDSQLNHLIFM